MGMGMMESSATTITMAPTLLRDLATSMFILADKFLLNLAQRHKFLEHFRFLVSYFPFFFRLFPSFFFWLDLNLLYHRLLGHDHHKYHQTHPLKQGNKPENYGTSDSGIARALSQLLRIMTEIPVSSRKYEAVRTLVEKLIDENQQENAEVLSEVNRVVLAAAFSTTLSQLEAAMVELGHCRVDGGSRLASGEVRYRVSRVLDAVRSFREGLWGRGWRARDGVDPARSFPEKAAAELLWLAQKLAACGYGEEAVWRWAYASNFARLSLSAEPRLQSSLVKVSAFLFKQAKDLGVAETDEARREQHRQTKLNMLLSWLPLLCTGSNGTDSPALSTTERVELERILADTIEMMNSLEEEEQVFSSWLHHFTHCPSSDWPNLYASYARWRTKSRKLLILQGK